jgi:hypothetical protein
MMSRRRKASTSEPWIAMAAGSEAPMAKNAWVPVTF